MGQPYVLLPHSGFGVADHWVEMAAECHVEGKLPKAERYYRRALDHDGANAPATNNLAVLHAQTDRLAEALLGIERALLFDPTQPIIHVNAAFLNLEAGFIDAALGHAAEARRLTPDRPTADTDGLAENGYQAARLVNATLCGVVGRAAAGIPYYDDMLAVDPANKAAGMGGCFAQTLADTPPREFLARRRRWRAAHGYRGTFVAHANDKDPDRPLRVGYVGADFKLHSAAMIFGNVVLDHDPAQVVPYLYATAPLDPDADPFNKLFRAAGTYREIHTLSDEQADALIRADQIDILVDLSGHTNGHRLPLFTRRPAPVQGTAWGFAVGTGLDEIDFFFADPVTVPEGERQYYAERVVDLPCVVTYRAPAEYGLPGVSDPPFRKNGHITFGSYTRHEKASDEYLAAVGEIMRRVPDSRVVFKDHAYRRPHSIRRVWQAMPDIDRGRIHFAGSTSHPEHLLACQKVDLFLDPFPHNGGVSSLEAAYMGIMFITRYGTNPAGRLGASILTQLGRPDWIAKSSQEYVETAVYWANRPEEMAATRKTLRDEFLASPIVTNYRAAVEEKYRGLWREWCANG